MKFLVLEVKGLLFANDRAIKEAFLEERKLRKEVGSVSGSLWNVELLETMKVKELLFIGGGAKSASYALFAAGGGGEKLILLKKKEQKDILNRFLTGIGI